MSDFVFIAKVEDIPEGQGKSIEVGDKGIAVFNVEGKFYALENACPHQGGPLGEGMLDGKEVICPWHAWGFDVTNGQCRTVEGLEQSSYELRVENDQILIKLV